MLCNVVFGLRQVLRVAPLNQPPSGWYGSMQPLRNARAASECSEYATDELLVNWTKPSYNVRPSAALPRLCRDTWRRKGH